MDPSSSRTESPKSFKMKSIQQYIDERPVWPDGTPISGVPMTGMQWLIWALAAIGKFFEGYVVFMTGVALPLISREFEIGSAQNGLIGAASLLGILVGAVGLGGMSDRFGRKPMFIIEMVIFVAFLILLTISTNFISLIICLFGIGLALGCDYPTAHMIISENTPSLSRGKLVLASTKQSDPAVATAIRNFLTWFIVPSETNDGYLDSVHFIALPPQVWALSEAQIQSVK
jgi:putative MFS transporter